MNCWGGAKIAAGSGGSGVDCGDGLAGSSEPGMSYEGLVETGGVGK